MTPKNEDLAQDVPTRPPLYGIDSMVFVYHFEAHPELGPAAGRLLSEDYWTQSRRGKRSNRQRISRPSASSGESRYHTAPSRLRATAR